jgi:tRNA A37 threonylcarbamoyladenosine synthetase subunit TsaC/SUA5/YrdC
LPGNEVAENNPYEIEEELGNQVDLIVDGGYLEETPTTVVNMVDDVIEVIREGSGDVSLLDI